MSHNYKNLLGIFSWFGYVLPLPQRLKLIKAAGFDATTLWWEDETGTPIIKKELMPAMVADSGLILENIHIPYHECDDLWSPNRSTRDAVVDQYCRWLYDCAEHNIPMMVMHVSDSLILPAPNHHGIESMTRLLKLAEDLEITIAVENTGREDYIAFVFSQISSPNLGFCYDSSHHRIYGQGQLDLLENLANHIVCTHLSDNDGQKDRHWLPGEGIIDWEMISRIFSSAAYQANYTLEVTTAQEDLGKTPAQFLAKAYQRATWFKKSV